MAVAVLLVLVDVLGVVIDDGIGCVGDGAAILVLAVLVAEASC